jgi:hypothetical protein
VAITEGAIESGERSAADPILATGGGSDGGGGRGGSC